MASRHDGGGGEARTPARNPQRIAEIAKQVLQQPPTAGVPDRLTDGADPAQPRVGLPARLARVHARAHVLLRFHLQMEPQFLLRLGVLAPAAEETAKPPDERSEPAHFVPPAQFNTPFTALCPAERRIGRPSCELFLMIQRELATRSSVCQKKSGAHGISGWRQRNSANRAKSRSTVTSPQPASIAIAARQTSATRLPTTSCRPHRRSKVAQCYKSTSTRPDSVIARSRVTSRSRCLSAVASTRPIGRPGDAARVPRVPAPNGRCTAAGRPVTSPGSIE